MQVGDLVTRDVITLRRQDPIAKLVAILGESAQDVFPVLDEADKLVGTVSELELVRVIGPNRRTFPFGPRKLAREGLIEDVGDVMTPRPSTARPGDSLESALRRMQELALPQLVVIGDDGRLVGLLRGREAFRAVLEGRT